MNWRRFIQLVAVAIAFLVVAGYSRLRFDTNILDLLPSHLHVVRGLQLHQAHFANAHELLIVVQGRTPEATQEAAATLAQGIASDRALAKGSRWQPPWTEHPDSIAEFLGWMWLQQPASNVLRLASEVAPVAVGALLREAREQLTVAMSPADLARLSYDPLGFTAIPGSGGLSEFEKSQSVFSSTDGLFRLVFVEPPSTPTSYKAQIAWLKTVEAKVAAIQSKSNFPANISIGFTGGPVFAAEAAGGMERDMTESAPVTLAAIGLLFWLAHRRVGPLAVIIGALLITVVATLGLGGLVFGHLNVVSLGFAAILLGLVVDYGLMTYQKFRASPGLPLVALQREIGPGIFWSALTTAASFLVLNFGGLPGLAQLGSLVSMGVVLGMAIMLFGFLPLAIRTVANRTHPIDSSSTKFNAKSDPGSEGGIRRLIRVGRWSSAWLIAACGVLAWRGLPAMDRSPQALRPRDSKAYPALDEIRTRMERTEDPLWLITTGRTEQLVSERLQWIRKDLESLQERGLVKSFALPDLWWPNPAVQETNRATLQGVGTQWPALLAAAQHAGFSSQALILDSRIAGYWSSLKAGAVHAWPTGALGSWVFQQAAARDETGFYSFGLIQPADATHAAAIQSKALEWNGSVLSGWSILGDSVLREVQTRLARVLAALAILLAACFWGAFGRWRESVLSLLTLLAGLVGLLAFMSLMHWSWNMLNLTALPLLLGSGAYYTIHVQLALRKYPRDLSALWHTTGRALLLCAATTVTGFGSLAWAGNAGLASMGQVCAAGIAMIFLVSMLALPAWWFFFAGPVGGSGSAVDCPVRRSSSIYRLTAWRAALSISRLVPASVGRLLSVLGAEAYRRLQPQRNETVVRNLAPIVGETEAVHVARRLFRNFGMKLFDLWRYEAGMPVPQLFSQLTGWNHIEPALQAGRGVLLVTIHLGNWEFGAPMLASRGVKLLVLTQPEPGTDFTEWRKAARARWGIETFVVGEDPFAFVEIIKCLQNGGAVALLMDRPDASSAVELELFGHKIQASVAAADLARASGCALIPAYIPKMPSGYAAHILAEVPYDRSQLGQRTARIQLTAEILRAFEQPLRQHADQWYHFVPIWIR